MFRKGSGMKDFGRKVCLSGGVVGLGLCLVLTAAVAPVSIIKAANGRLSVHVEAVEIQQVLDQISAQTGIRIVTPLGLQQRVSVRFDDLTVEAGLQRLLQLAGLSYVFLYHSDSHTTSAGRLQQVRVLTRGTGTLMVEKEPPPPSRGLENEAKQGNLLQALQQLQGMPEGEVKTQAAHEVTERLTDQIIDRTLEHADTPNPVIAKFLDVLQKQGATDAFQELRDTLQKR
jgi:hypothetical protein